MELREGHTAYSGQAFEDMAAGLLDAARPGQFATVITAHKANPENTFVKVIRWEFNVNVTGDRIGKNLRKANFLSKKDPWRSERIQKRWAGRIWTRDGRRTPFIRHLDSGEVYLSLPWRKVTSTYIERATGRQVPRDEVPNVYAKRKRDRTQYCTPKLSSLIEVRAAGRKVTRKGWRSLAS